MQTHLAPEFQGTADGLAAEARRNLVDKSEVLESRALDADLLDSEGKNPGGLIDRRDPTAVADRHVALTGELLDHLEVRAAAEPGCLDIEDDEFVRVLLVEDTDRGVRVADVLGLPELLRLDQARPLEEKAGNDAGPQHRIAKKRRSSSRPNL